LQQGEALASADATTQPISSTVTLPT